MKLSIIISILESYRITIQQLHYLQKILSKNEFSKDCELIFADDGSDPPLRPIIEQDFGHSVKEDPENVFHYDLGFAFRLFVTNDFRPWTQPLARNNMAKFAEGQKLLMTDIDHIITEDAIRFALIYPGARAYFQERIGYLDSSNCVIESEKLLGVFHPNTFVMSKTVFLDDLKGYGEKTFCVYGTDTGDLLDRYGNLILQKKVFPPVISHAVIYSYKDPQMDVTKFHALKRKTDV
jgi:hypothetical protein